MQQSENNKRKSPSFEIWLCMWYALKLDVRDGYKTDFIAYKRKYRLAITLPWHPGQLLNILRVGDTAACSPLGLSTVKF